MHAQQKTEKQTGDVTQATKISDRVKSKQTSKQANKLERMHIPTASLASTSVTVLPLLPFFLLATTGCRERQEQEPTQNQHKLATIS